MQPGASFLRNTGPSGGYTFQNMLDWSYHGPNVAQWQESYATASLADYDNDSYLDLYFTTAYPGNHPRLYRNNGGTWNFSDVTSAEGLGGQPSTFQAAWADFDNDGDLDLVGAGILYRNNTTGNNWLQVDLRGDGLNVSTTAIGAVVRAEINGKTVARQVDGGSGQGNQNDQTLHFGLGNSSQPVPLEVTWPDGTVRTLHASVNQKITVDYNEREAFVNVIDIGEVGIVDRLTHNSQTVVLNQHYHNPVVFAQPLSYNGVSPAVVRVEKIQSDRFDLFIAEPSDENGLHASQETASYIVIEAGNYVLADGTRLEVGTVDTSATVGNHLHNSWELVRFDTTFATNFSSTPVVLSQVQTHHGPDYLQTRHLSTSQSSVTLAMQQEEAATAVLDTETVGYLAIETGAGQWNGMAYEAKLIPYFLTHNWSKVQLANDLNGSTISMLASLDSYIGGDSAHLRYQNIQNGDVEFKVEEDTTFDTETIHYSAESLAYLAIGGEGILRAQIPEYTVGEVKRITNLTHEPQLIFLNQKYQNPVVFAQSASHVGNDPVSVRVSNVQSDRFTIQLTEPSDRNGLHDTAETVTYIVLEAGTHQLIDGTRLEVGSLITDATVGLNMENQWHTISFTTTFTSSPVIFSQIQTMSEGGQSYLQTRQDAIRSSGFQLALEPEQAVTTQHVPEQIGYFAIEAGRSTWNGMAFEANTTGLGVTDQFDDISFEGFYSDTPGFLSSLATYIGQDNAHVRYTSLHGEGVQLKIGEDTTYDTEVTHTAEVVSYLAIEGPGLLLATVPQWDIGEVGRITNLTHTPQTIMLSHQYHHPVVFAQSTTAVGPDPVSVRVRNVQPNQFQIYLTEPSNLNGLHNSAESVTYMVLEAGTHRLSNGTNLEVGTVETDATVGTSLANPSWETITLAASFSETPVLLSQIQTHSTAGASYLQTRQMSDSTSVIKLALEQEEATSEPHATETIGYMAIEPGSGVWSGMVYETATSDNAITHNWYDLAFDHYYGSEPAFLSSLATYYGYDNSHLRYENLTPAGVQIKVTEDTTADTELNHNSAEAASYFVLGMGEAGSSASPGLLSAVTPKIPPHVTAFVRDDGDDKYDTVLESLAVYI